MRLPGFIFGSNDTQSKIADGQRTVNWYVEDPQAPGGRAALFPTPGVTSLSTNSSSNPGRAHFYEGGREFGVFGTDFAEIDRVGNQTSRGTVTTDTNPATISTNGDGGGELFITSGGNGYYYTLSTDTLTQITALNGIADMGAHIDGYFLALDASTSTLYISALLDGSSWTTGTDFAQRSAESDDWVALKAHGRYAWLFGEHTSEVWYNTGATFPFALHPSGVIRYGCAAPWSVAVVDQSLLWLGSSRFGDGFVLQAQGFAPQVTSTYAVQKAINSYGTISDAQGWGYTDQGHSFYVLSFPTEDKTWVLDLNTGVWHERGTWIEEEGKYVSWRPRWYARAFGQHRVLDGNTGDVYNMSLDTHTDVDSRAIRRLRRTPIMSMENDRLFYSSLELELESGLGLQTGQGSDPQVMMRFSDDGGQTWSAERWAGAGKVGKYGYRTRWNRLGAGRRRVFEISVSDPIPWRLVDAYIKPPAGYQFPQRRSA